MAKVRRSGPDYENSTGDKIFHFLNYGVFTIFTLTCIFPFYYIFINTI